MIELFTEDPWPLVWLCAMAELGLLIALYATGRRKVLVALPVPAVAVGVLLLLDWLIVTPKEEIAGAVAAMAEAVRQRDADALLSYVAEDATFQRGGPGSFHATVRSVLGNLEMERLRLSDVEITFSKRLQPPRATVELRASASGRFRENSFSLALSFWRIVFRHRDGRWVVTEAEGRQVDRQGLVPVP